MTAGYMNYSGYVNSRHTTDYFMKEIQKTRERMSMKLEELASIQTDSYGDLVYYFVIVGIMCFFLYIVLNDIYKTLKFFNMQNEDSRRSSYKLPKHKEFTNDNYNYDNTKYNMINSNMSIRQSLENSQEELEKEFQDILEFKDKQNLDNTLKTSITTKVINHENDNYIYNNTKTPKDTFWNSIFKKSKYPSVVNNADGHYLELI